jgi:hypothetical protein
VFTRTDTHEELWHIRAHTRFGDANTRRITLIVCPPSQETASGASPVHDGGHSAGSGNVSGEVTVPAEDK